MANSSLLGGENVPAQSRGKDVDALGPSDNSDSGSDTHAGSTSSVQAAVSTTSDSQGTGERATVGTMDPSDGADILPDRIGTAPIGSHAAESDPMDDPAAEAPDELAADDEDADARDA